jgi:molybdopterin converting factor small subunit
VIEVRLFASLAGTAGIEDVVVEPRPGLTVADVLREVGLDRHELYVIVLNSQRATAEAVLADGDRLSLFPPMSGG